MADLTPVARRLFHLCTTLKRALLRDLDREDNEEQRFDMAEIRCDALVVGAGLGGIYQTLKLRTLGLHVVCIERAPEVGGTWYWNRYPGAMSDTESYLYRYSWDKDDLQTYQWDAHYLYQPDILKYINHVVDRHDVRKQIHFNVAMESATWNEQEQRWTMRCNTGDVFNARYLVNALGILSTPNYPNIAGLKSFRGDLIHTTSWPDIDLSSKRVGVIGNGSTGIQVMTALAPKVKKLVSFQRSPQYSVPSGQGPVTREYRDWVNKNYDEIYEKVWKSSTGFGVPEVDRPTMSVDAEKRREIFEQVWSQGNGFRFMFSGFGDITTSVQANREACKFIHSKIDEIVKDSKKADALKPTELYARRPLCDNGYYQIFNRENVDIVDLRQTPIKEVVSDGIRLSDDAVVELDTLILATGFDALEGSYLRVAIKGQEGKTLQDHWENGAITYAGVACAGFPNMFMVSGPQGPFANFPCTIESEVNFITECIEHSQNRGGYIVAKPESEIHWLDLCNRLTEGSVFKTTRSWIFGQNIEGRGSSVKFFFGGLASYIAHTKQEVHAGFPSFEIVKNIDFEKDM